MQIYVLLKWNLLIQLKKKEEEGEERKGEEMRWDDTRWDKT